MPTYQYACTACGAQSEVVQKFTDEPLTVCGTCGGRLRKVFSPVGIVFKGPGFYRTDSRTAAKEPVAAGRHANGSNGAAGDSASTSKEPKGSSSSSSSPESAPSANGSSSGSSAADGTSSSSKVA